MKIISKRKRKTTRQNAFNRTFFFVRLHMNLHVISREICDYFPKLKTSFDLSTYATSKYNLQYKYTYIKIFILYTLFLPYCNCNSSVAIINIHQSIKPELAALFSITYCRNKLKIFANFPKVQILIYYKNGRLPTGVSLV